MLDERQINILESLHVPNTYWKGKTKEYKYWFRSLLQKIDSSLIFSGFPENWSNDFFMLCLWALGYVAVFDTARWGVSFWPCTLGGYDFYLQPEWVQVSNPKYCKRLYVGKDCEILKLTPDFRGVFDIIDYYASKLAEASKGIDMGLINTKLPCILTAANQAQAETLKRVYDKVQSGESLVVYQEEEDDGEIIPRKEPFEFWNQDYKQTYIVHNLLEDLQMILDSFYMEIGLPTTIEKAAHILESEASFQSAQSQARVACWVTTLRESFEKINKRFGLNLEVQYACENDDSWLGEPTEDSEQKYKR